MSACTASALLLAALLGGCYRGPAPDPNPPAPGFDLAGSDAGAIEIADRVVQAMGGRRRWERTRVIAWNAGARRRLMWDRHDASVRIEYLEGPALDVALHLDTGAGRAWRDGVEVADPVELAALLAEARADWRADSTRLVLPYRLKDDGARLRSLGERALGARTFDVLELRFAHDPPGSRYELLVSRDRALVERWSRFEGGAAEPSESVTWTNWRFYGGVALAGDTGAGGASAIDVLDAPPPGMLERPRAGS